MSMNENCGIGNAQCSCIEINEKVIYPCVDAHMHIQSNDIAPIPIMYGMLNFKVSRLIHEFLTSGQLKDKMNFANLSYIEKIEDEIKKLSPANRGGLIAVDFANSDMEINRLDVLKELSVLAKIAITLSSGTLTGTILLALLTAAGLILNPDPDIQRRRLTNITGIIMPYGDVTCHNSFLIAGIYKDNAMKDSKFNYASRISPERNETKDIKEGVKERERLVTDREDKGKEKNYFSVVSRHYYGNRYFNIGFNFKMSIIYTMELMYAHYWGAYGIPVYIPGEDGKLYKITNNIKCGKEKVFCSYDIKKETAEKIVNGTALNVGNTPVINNGELGKSEKYCHFLKPVPETEINQYEDFTKHIKHTEAATVKYPLEYFPFYHLDPRRFFSPVDKISKYHDFYCCTKEKISITEGDKIIQTEGKEIKINKMEDNWIINNFEKAVWKYKMNIEEIKPLLLHEENGKWTEGLFWGIKMYAALGYPPYLFDTGDASYNTKNAFKVFRCLEKDNYKGLLDFYNYCAVHEIPVTCHASPQGMTIADPGIYLKEFLKDNPGSGYGNITKVNFPMDGKSFMNGIGLIDSFSSHKSWELVLSSLNNANRQKFTLCLAHFGGQRYFNGEFSGGKDIDAPAEKDEDTPYRWLDGISELIEDFNGIYTDISCFTYKEFVEFPETITSEIYDYIERRVNKSVLFKIYHNTGEGGVHYFDSTFIREKNLDTPTLNEISRIRIELVKASDRFRQDLNCYSSLNKTAKTLTKLIKHNEKLQYRIMAGTDWPMTEMDLKGVSRYNSAMFVLLQMVTEYLGNEWDAWHQFSVINPLRFLGLLEMKAYDTKGSNYDSYRVNFMKIDKMKLSIEKYIEENKIDDEKEFIDNYVMKKDNCIKDLDDRYDELTKMYRYNAIPAAHKMMNKHDNKLLLTNKYKE